MKRLGLAAVILAVCFTSVGCRCRPRLFPMCDCCGCGQRYWGDWQENLPYCQDCCNGCGNWTGPPSQYHRGDENACGCGGGCGCSSGGCSTGGCGCGSGGMSTQSNMSSGMSGMSSNMPRDGQIVPGSERWSTEQVGAGSASPAQGYPTPAPAMSPMPNQGMPNQGGMSPMPMPRPSPMGGATYRSSPNQRNMVRARPISNVRRPAGWQPPMPDWAQGQ